MEAPSVRAEAADGGGRPEGLLPLRELLQVSIYWFGIQAIWGALGVQALPPLVERMIGPLAAPTGVGVIGAAGVIVAILIQPTAGAVSDYTISRWGRRKPYIAIGATLDVLFLVGIALANDIWILAVFVVLLQFSSNFAQGPFQGYVPDLVPARQVGLASGLMGLMIVLGLAGGAAAVTASIALYDSFGIGIHHRYGLALVGVGLVEFATAVATIVLVREGRGAKPRAGRSWWEIARSAWGTDILRERSYVWLVVSRLLILTANGLMAGTAFFYMTRSMGFDPREAATWIFVATAAVAGTPALAVIPSGILSNRYGRKRMIYLGALLGALGMAVAAVAPRVEIAIAGATLVGLGAGTFLAVDWALMTDIIPKASSGRYMGISNVATGLASLFPQLITAVAVTGVSIALNNPTAPLGPRVAVASSLVLYALGALALRPVNERRREDFPPAEAASAASAAGSG